MSNPSSQTRLAPAQGAIDRYFELSLYLLVSAGFGVLAGTGGLDPPSLVVVGGALVVRGYMLAKRRRWVISEGWTTPLSVAYFIFFALDYLVVSRSFLPATIHLTLFGVVVRMFSIRRERDYITLAILSFLMVLAAAVLTVDSVFLFSFAAFLLTAVATFILLEMRRSRHAASVAACHSSDRQEHRHLAIALVRVTPALMGMILILGVGLFFLMPRLSAGYLGEYSFGTDISSGFSDHVQLGQIGRIQQSNSVVMHVQVDGDTVGRYALYWRGIALAEFDGSSWSSLRDQTVLRRQEENTFALPRFDEISNASIRASRRENLIHYRVLMEPIGTNVFFLAPWARSVSGGYRLLASDSAGAVYDLDSQHAISRYEATSDIATPTADELRASVQHHRSTLENVYLRLPAVDPRISKLATQITASRRNDYDKAVAIEQHLRTHFGYTLELPRMPVKDPIANFLFQRKQGHCEYFASSMAVMLRTLGIPARVVNGFRSDEFNDITGSYVVRAKDAHAWVEAYFPGFGWQTFDPTPGGNASGTPQGWGRLALYVDAMASFWREWVVSYDSSHQYVLGKAAISSSRGAWEGARQWAREHYDAMVKWASRSQERVEHSPGRWTIVGAVVVAVLMLVANLAKIARWLYEKWLGAHPERSPEQAASMWYQRMARVVARQGLTKAKTQTPQEFVRKIEDPTLRESVARFTRIYESARFGKCAEDAGQLQELYEEVEAATRSE